MPNDVVLILGAGPHIGHYTTLAFKARGYSVAIAARSLKDGYDGAGNLQMHLDLADSNTLPDAFAKVKVAFGNPPSVVVYNGYSRTLLDRDDPLSSVNVTETLRDMTVNAISPLIAAKYAVAGFGELPDSSSKTFIYTGNKLNVMVQNHTITFGMGKSAVAHAVHAMAKAYGNRGYRFYYTDERHEDGKHAAEEFDGPARGDLYAELAGLNAQGPWHYTFVKGEGYKDFAEIDRSSE